MQLSTLLFLNLGAGEVFIIILIIVMFFGTKNLPQLARGLGKGIRDFREAAGNIQREIQTGAEEFKKTVDLNQEMQELREATDIMKADIQEGLNNIQNDANEAMRDDLPEEKQEQQLAAPEQETTETTTEITPIAEITTPPEPPADSEIPGSIKRK